MVWSDDVIITHDLEAVVPDQFPSGHEIRTFQQFKDRRDRQNANNHRRPPETELPTPNELEANVIQTHKHQGLGKQGRCEALENDLAARTGTITGWKAGPTNPEKEARKHALLKCGAWESLGCNALNDETDVLGFEDERIRQGVIQTRKDTKVNCDKIKNLATTNTQDGQHTGHRQNFVEIDEIAQMAQDQADVDVMAGTYIPKRFLAGGRELQNQNNTPWFEEYNYPDGADNWSRENSRQAAKQLVKSAAAQLCRSTDFKSRDGRRYAGHCAKVIQSNFEHQKGRIKELLKHKNMNGLSHNPTLVQFLGHISEGRDISEFKGTEEASMIQVIESILSRNNQTSTWNKNLKEFDTLAFDDLLTQALNNHCYHQKEKGSQICPNHRVSNHHALPGSQCDKLEEKYNLCQSQDEKNKLCSDNASILKNCHQFNINAWKNEILAIRHQSNEKDAIENKGLLYCPHGNGKVRILTFGYEITPELVEFHNQWVRCKPTKVIYFDIDQGTILSHPSLHEEQIINIMESDHDFYKMILAAHGLDDFPKNFALEMEAFFKGATDHLQKIIKKYEALILRSENNTLERIKAVFNGVKSQLQTLRFETAEEAFKRAYQQVLEASMDCQKNFLVKEGQHLRQSVKDMRQATELLEHLKDQTARHTNAWSSISVHMDSQHPLFPQGEHKMFRDKALH